MNNSTGGSCALSHITSTTMTFCPRQRVHRPRHARRCPLGRLALRQAEPEQERQGGEVRDVQRDEARGAGAAADAAERASRSRRRTPQPGCRYTRPDCRRPRPAPSAAVMVLISLPPAKIVTSVALVRTNGISLGDEVAGDEAAVLLAERLKVRRDDGGRNTEIDQRNVESPRFQVAGGDRWVAHAVRAVRKRQARHARSDSVGVAGADASYTIVDPGAGGPPGAVGLLSSRPSLSQPPASTETSSSGRDP